MDNGRTSDLTNKKFSWKIEKFSTLSPKKLYSPIFTVGGYPWRILMFPKGNMKKNYLSIYLDAADSAISPRGWSRNATFTLAVINQVDSKMTVEKEMKKLKEKVDASETEMKKLKEKLAASEVDLETARRDLVEAQEGFEERDIDAELGYGRP